MASITLRKGDDQTIRGVVSQSHDSAVPVDITGWMIWFSVKRRWPDTDGQSVVAKVVGGDIAITDGPAGKFTISIRPSDFASIPNAERTSMLYDVQARKADAHIQTLAQGDLIVLGDVTNTIS